MAHMLQERYSNLVDLRLRKSLVTKDKLIFNNRYEGSPKAGAVKIPTRDEVAVSAYDKANGLAPSSKGTTYKTMTIDKDYAINEIIDGFDAESVPDGIVADRLDSGGYGLANKLDEDGCAELIKNGTAATNTTALTKATVYEAVVDARTALSEANVPVENRYLLVSPSVFSLLLKNPDFIKASDIGQKIVETGAIGQIAGFNVYESNNLVTTESKTTIEFVAGHPNCATRAKEFSVPVHLQDLGGSGKYIGACAVQGRAVYEHMVTKAEGIYVKKAVTA